MNEPILNSTSPPPAAAANSDSAIPERRRQSIALRRMVVQVTRVSLIVVAILLVVAGYLYYSAQQLPEFYKTALSVAPTIQRQAGDQFETQVLNLQNNARQTGHWRASFSESELNGWLAADLPEKFPDALPHHISEPRVRISQGEFALAFRLESRRISGVVVVTGDLFCTEEENQIAIRIKSAKSGLVPLPMGPWLDETTHGLRLAGCPVEWKHSGSDSVVLVTLPARLMQLANQIVILETIQTQPGSILVGGTTRQTNQVSATSSDELSLGRLLENATKNR